MQEKKISEVIDMAIQREVDAIMFYRELSNLMASHRELKSYKFYSELARLHPEGNLRTTLLKMASEELAHKEKMEYLYSNTAFPQTAGG